MEHDIYLISELLFFSIKEKSIILTQMYFWLLQQMQLKTGFVVQGHIYEFSTRHKLVKIKKLL